MGVCMRCRVKQTVSASRAPRDLIIACMTGDRVTAAYECEKAEKERRHAGRVESERASYRPAWCSHTRTPSHSMLRYLRLRATLRVTRRRAFIRSLSAA